MNDFFILVPKGPVDVIAPGSAIVVPCDDWFDHEEGLHPSAKAYYEGGIYQPMTFDEKLMHAADRCAQDYPTIAYRYVNQDEFEVVGYYSLRRRAAYIGEGAKLLMWIGP